MKKTSRIVINVADDVTPEDAALYVSAVMGRGKISGDGKSYCYGTRFRGHLNITTDKPRKRSPNTYTFYVYKDA